MLFTNARQLNGDQNIAVHIFAKINWPFLQWIHTTFLKSQSVLTTSFHVYRNGSLQTNYQWMSIKQNSWFSIIHNDKLGILFLHWSSEPLERVSEFNCSGLTLDEHLSRKPHVQKIANKISRTIGILRRLKNILPTPVLLTLYDTLILPHFHYGFLNWGISMGRLQLL